MENYMQYNLMGLVGQVRMKPGCMPTKFECQTDRKTRTPNPIERPFILKKRRMMAIEDSIKDLEERSMVTKHIEQEEVSSGSSAQPTEVHLVSRENKTIDKSVQVYIIRKFRSRAIQTELKLVNRMSSPLKPDLKTVSTSPFKIKSSCRIQPSRPGINVQKNLFRKDEQSGSDTSYTPSVVYTGSSPSIKSIQMESTSDCSETFEDDNQQEAKIILQSIMKIITNNPRRYIGVPVDCYFSINLIQEQLLQRAKLSKTEVKETKQIAILRIHIERVIRHIREFNILKPHACVNLNTVKVLDDIIVIACDLINLQDSFIK